jgi:hypothetical protein
MRDETYVATAPRPLNGPPAPHAEPALGDLFKQLAQDSAVLVRQEIALAKAEMRANLKSTARDAAMAAAGGALAAVGSLVLIAFLVMLVGDAVDEYWLGALIVGGLFTLVGGILAKKALNNLKHDSLTPEQTLTTLKEDKQWVQSEIQAAKRGRA